MSKRIIIAVALVLAIVSARVAMNAHATGTVGDNTVMQRTSCESITSGGSAHRIYWDRVLNDDDAWAKNGSVTVRYSGVYVVTVQTGWADNNNGIRSVHLQRDQNTNHPIEVLAGANTRTPQWGAPLAMSWTGHLDAGDTLATYAYQTSGVTLCFGGNVRSPGTASGNNEIGVTRLR